MPKSSRHKSHKHSKHSSRDYSDSEEDAVKTKEKSNKDNGSTRGHRGSVSGEKRKKESKDLSGHVNGDLTEEYVSSKRQKEKDDVSVGGDRWSGDGEEREDRERRVEKVPHKGEILKLDVKLKENSSKGESSRGESKSRSKRHDSGISGERREDSLISALVEKEGSKTKGESKRRSERDSSSRKEGKGSKDKDRRSDKEKNGGQESKSGDAEVKLVDMDIGEKQGAQLSDLSGAKQNKRSRENNAEHASLFELKIPDLDKHIDKKIRKKREGSSEREKYRDEQKESDGRRVSSKGDRANDSKHRDDKYMDGVYPDKYQEDGYKEDKRRDDKYRDEADEGYSRSRDDRHRGDGDRDYRHKDEKQRYDGERDRRRKDDKYHEVIEREARREDKYHEDGDRDYKRKADRNHDDSDKDIRRGDERYYEDGDRDDRRRDSSYRDDVVRDYRHMDEKYHDDIERDIRYKDSKQGGASNRENISRDSKYRDERSSRDRAVAGDKYDSKRTWDDTYGADHHVRKSNAYDDNPTRDDQTTRYQDDQGRRRTYEKEEYSDVKSRVSKDQRYDAEKKSVSSAKMDPGTDRVRPNPRRWSSPTSTSHAPSDNYRSVKQDDTKYRDYNYEDRSRHNTNPTTDYSSRSLDKLSQKDNPHFGETNEGNLKLNKSPSASVDRRQSTQRNINFDESTQRSAGSRAEEHVPVNTDTLSISSPFARNSHHFSSNSKSFPPQPSSFRMDHKMGRMQGNNAWRGVPSWPSPVPNGFLPFPHTPPFHSLMQPFHTPPMFGVRPSMELNHHHTPYHMPPDANRFSAPGQPMGWHYQVDDSFPPQSHRTMSLEMMPSSLKENNSSIRSGDDEALGGHDEQNRDGQQFDNVSAVVQSSKRVEKNENRESVYLSKLDISAELAEPELYDKCMGLIDMDKDSEVKIMASQGFLSFAPFSSNVDSIFKKSMSLYKIQKESLVSAYGEKPKAIPGFDQEDINMQDKNEKLSPTLQENIEGPTDNIITACVKDEVKSLGTNYAPLLNSDVLSEASDAMMPDLSRIHLSPESTH